jgi:cytoskeleton protein RodZ
MAETTGASASDTGVGALLRASRMRIGEDLRNVALMLRIRYPYLEAIEDGRFEDLPGQAYAVGFIRAYANHLGLDGEEVVRRFKDDAAHDEEPRTNLRFPTPVTEASVPGGAIVFIGLLIIILAYGAWYVSTSDENYLADLIEPIPERLVALVSSDKSWDDPTPEPTMTLATTPSEPEPTATPKPLEPPASLQPADTPVDASAPTAAAETVPSRKPQVPALTLSVPFSVAEPAPVVAAPLPDEAPAATAPAAATEPVLNAPTETVLPGEQAAASTDTSAALDPATASTEISTRSEANTSATPAPENATAVAEPEAAAEAPAEPKSRVLVRAKSNSWIQVRDDFSNEIMMTRLLKAGEEYYVPDKFGLRLLTGNAGALEILVDGKSVPPIGLEGAVRRGVQLDPALLKAGDAVSE